MRVFRVNPGVAEHAVEMFANGLRRARGRSWGGMSLRSTSRGKAYA